ncbi:hypothetical protein NEOLEDRAFT_1132445 [Neolentinus lepideus HHB14362 ss-1]|uniref:RNA polymerase I-specific transcription initiation factor RRN6-like protein n=1 Tax=Neolentinus lepideus HHB14362 ss-1 TaxID=1314782 RepID=A0A165TAQ5_9AGAM|nr:hypothetical protein NEOLEDRAFT_1132445 [Neolentinus lepideus HHB14362 ss-1]
MDIWLSDDRPARGRTSHGIRKGKNKKEESPWNYPLIEDGSLTAVSLTEERGKLQWTFPSRDSGRRIHIRGNTCEIFPSTCSLAAPIPNTSIQHGAEQGANFIRTYFPDVDIPGELLREEIAADMQASRKLRQFDPYMGDTLEVVDCYDGPRRHGLALVFPMGESKRDLNLSPFSYDQMSGAVFKPSADPIKTFETPIMQIASSSADSATARKSLIAVRTFSSTTLLEVNCKISGVYNQTVSNLNTVTLGVVRHSEFGSRQIVDVKICPTSDAQLFFADDEGTAYTCRIAGGKNTINVLHSGVGDEAIVSQDPFQRITLAKDAGWLLLSSSRAINKLDSRSPSAPSFIFSTEDSGSFVTHVEAPRLDHLFCVTTTEHILWIDERFAHKPVLGHKHKREFDRTLFTVTTSTLSSPLALLASKRNDLITVYDVSRDSEDGLVYSHAQPHSLVARPSSAPYTGSRLLAHPLQKYMQDISLVRLSHRGALYCTDLRFSMDVATEDNAEETTSTKYEWSEAVRSLEDEGRLRPDVGPLGGREFTQVDLWPAYERLMITGRRQDEEQDPEAVYELLEKMPTFKQNLDVPVDNVLTTFDIAFLSGDEPLQTSRSDFVTQSALNSTRGYRALMQGRIPKKQLIDRMPWHTNIAPVLHHFDPETAGDKPEEVLERLHQHDLELIPDRPGPSYRLEAEAREQLTLDLALSSDIFSVNPFQKPRVEDDALEDMSRATESMSISVSEPPPVRFGYLRPVMKSKMAYYSREEQPKGPAIQGVELPIGARLLLQEWEVGEDPNDYLYRDPYDAGAVHVKAATRPKAPASVREVLFRSRPDAQRPPLIVPARTLAPSIPTVQTIAKRPVTQSQDVAMPDLAAETSQPMVAASQSQDIFMTNTQILPGPFGGRLPVGKKKTAKKRMGGF